MAPSRKQHMPGFTKVDNIQIFINFIRNLIEFDKKGIFLASNPVFLEVDTTSRCNLRCLMCPRDEKEVGKDMPDKILYSIKNFMRTSKRISLHVSGEPLLCKKLAQIIDLIPKITKITFNSNLQCLSDETIAIFKRRKGTINVSLDTPCEDKYKIIRGGSLEKVIQNIKMIKRETNWNIFLNMTLMQLNKDEVGQFIDLAECLNVEGVVFYRLNEGFDFVKKRSNIVFDYKSQHLSENDRRKIKDLISKRKGKIFISDGVNLKNYNKDERCLSKLHRQVISITKLPLVMDKIDSLNYHFVKKSLCYAPWGRLLIKVDGEVRFCCWQKEPIGNLHEKTIEGIWNSKKAMFIRREMRDNRFPFNCQNSGCPLIL